MKIYGRDFMTLEEFQDMTVSELNEHLKVGNQNSKFRYGLGIPKNCNKKDKAEQLYRYQFGIKYASIEGGIIEVSLVGNNIIVRDERIGINHVILYKKNVCGIILDHDYLKLIHKEYCKKMRYTNY